MTPAQLAALLAPAIAAQWPSLAVAVDYSTRVLTLAEELAAALTVPPVRVVVEEVVVEDRRE